MTGNADDAAEDALRQAAARLAAKGFLKPGDTISQCIPERNRFVSAKTPPDQYLGLTIAWIDLAGTPSDLHHRIYAARPDVGAIAAAALTWTSALSRLSISLPPIFDEQIRHLGTAVLRLSMQSTDGKPVEALKNGANAYMLDDTVLCFGMELERLLANVEILEKCAQSFVLAHCTSQHVKLIPWLVKFIANGRLKKDQKDAAARHLRGERAIMKSSY